MQVILKEKIENLGTLGSIVNVKPGYARNYLLAYDKAIQATKENIADFEKQKERLQHLEEERLSAAKTQAEKISDQVFAIKASAGEGGKLFGSIGAKEIVNVLLEAGIDVQKRHIHITENTIRSLGEHEVSVHLYSGIDVNIKLMVTAV